MAAPGERQAEDRVAGLEYRGIDRLVRLRARVRLHVRPGRAEQALRALDGKGLGQVDVLAAAVVALARVALGVLVGEHAALRDQHLAADVIFRGDQLDVVFLPLLLAPDRVPDFAIRLCKKVRREHRATKQFYQRASMRYLMRRDGR